MFFWKLIHVVSPTEWQTEILNIGQMFFAMVYGFEAMFKLFALGPEYYFHNVFNTIDMMVALAAIAGIGLDEMSRQIAAGASSWGSRLNSAPTDR